jgi:hypothetical protein
VPAAPPLGGPDGAPLTPARPPGHRRPISATHHPEKPIATTTDPSVADHRPNGRPVGTYTTHTGAQPRLWRQRGRDGIRLVDVALNGRGRRYLIERALTAGEVDAIVADYLAEAAELGDCPMRSSRVARALEALLD